jgi:hypothetical protein
MLCTLHAQAARCCVLAILLLLLMLLLAVQVPSCCVLTNLGLSILPGSQAGASCHTAAVSRLAADLQAAAAGHSFWGNKLTMQLKNNSQPTGGCLCGGA